MKVSRKGRTVYAEVGFWWDERDRAIHVAVPPSKAGEVETFHVAVRSDPEKPSGHPYLFRELARCLRQLGAPAPEEKEATVK